MDPGFRGMAGMVERGLEVPVKGRKRSAVVQYFVPVKDSMGEIAAALEVFTMAVAGNEVRKRTGHNIGPHAWDA